MKQIPLFQMMSFSIYWGDTEIPKNLDYSYSNETTVVRKKGEDIT